MTFSELPPSKQWAALKYRGEKFAEVWFKPEGEPCGLTFRIPRESFLIPSMEQHLTPENLLKAVAVTPAEVESWRQDEQAHSGMGESSADFTKPLRRPAPPSTHVDIHVRLNPPEGSLLPTVEDKGAASAHANGPKATSINWNDLEARWRAILVLETALDALRNGMEGLLTEMENSLRHSLTLEEKTHAPRADLSQWERAKKRVQFALPKVKDFVHRSTWATASPERKRLDELYKQHIQPHVPFPRMEEVLKQLEDLQKDRQVLSGLGKTVYHEAKAISAEIQGALKTLHNNAMTAAQRKRGGAKGRFLK